MLEIFKNDKEKENNPNINSAIKNLNFIIKSIKKYTTSEEIKELEDILKYFNTNKNYYNSKPFMYNYIHNQYSERISEVFNKYLNNLHVENYEKMSMLLINITRLRIGLKVDIALIDGNEI